MVRMVLGMFEVVSVSFVVSCRN